MIFFFSTPDTYAGLVSLIKAYFALILKKTTKFVDKQLHLCGASWKLRIRFYPKANVTRWHIRYKSETNWETFKTISTVQH